MNHKNASLAMAAIVSAIALTGVAFAIPQQALAYGHHHNHHGNSIEVDQQVTQQNSCDTGALCDNEANNSVDIDR